MPRRKKNGVRRERKPFPHFIEDKPVETDLRYWLIHVLHWHALLFAVIAFFVVGMTFFNKADAANDAFPVPASYPQ